MMGIVHCETCGKGSENAMNKTLISLDVEDGR